MVELKHIAFKKKIGLNQINQNINFIMNNKNNILNNNI